MLSILIIIDGCNEDYINAKSTPFLYNLRLKSNYFSMEVTPSFAAGVELFTGNLPETTDTFVDFCLGPNILPLQTFKILGPSRRLNPVTERLKYKKVSILSVLYFLFTGIWINFGNIPLPLLPYFCVNKSILKNKKMQKKISANNLMGILKSNGFKVKFIYGDTENINNKILKYSLCDKEIIILHYGETDYIGHRFGPNSQEIQDALKLIDESIKCIYEQFESKLDLIVVFGDHNMEEVNNSINLWEKLQQLDVKLIKDYFAFLNSPMARFWFRNKLAQRKIRALLESLYEYGREVTKEEMKQKRLPADDKYGELIFWANKGVNFSPDFYNSVEIKGMHGYFDDSATTPLIIWNKNNKEVTAQRRCKLRDITPTVLDFLGLKYSRMNGKSLLMND